MYQFYNDFLVVLYTSCAIDPVSATPLPDPPIPIHQVQMSDEIGGTLHGGVFQPIEFYQDIRIKRADDHEYLELPGMPEDPYVEAAPSDTHQHTLQYVTGPEDQADINHPSTTELCGPGEDDDEDPKEDPVDYPADGEDDGDDEDDPSEEDD
ncbi:hypothetical protein Tco_0824742 [Tanacetum coccineum]|uniref:Uncharacterized protein n=1 Tax=Tanacetum coccineum TaxID=301880 RepID=A0ABQ5AQY0_9ASTR